MKNQPTLGDITSMHDVSSNGSFAHVQNILNDNEHKSIPYIRSGNVGKIFLNLKDLALISKNAHDQLSLSCTKFLDIIMARKGKIGGATIITEDDVNYNCNENVIKLTLHDTEYLNPLYVVTFLNSKYGISQLERLATGNVQPWVSIFQIRKIRCYYLNKKFQNAIANLVKSAKNINDRSKEFYDYAEKLLLDYITFRDDECTSINVTYKRFSSSFSLTGRLDAEYYQPKFNKLIQDLAKHNPYKLSGESGLVSMMKSSEPGSDYYGDIGIPFVRISNLSKFEINDPDIKIPMDSVSNITSLYPKKDTILLSKDGSVGIAYKVEQDMECVTSSAILHLKINDTSVILPDYLTLVLNSKVVQMQAERDAGGSIIQHWRPSEIADVIIPVLDMDKQIEISEKVIESFSLRKKSEELLELAKNAVEVAIEQGEDVAMKMLEVIDYE